MQQNLNSNSINKWSNLKKKPKMEKEKRRSRKEKVSRKKSRRNELE